MEKLEKGHSVYHFLQLPITLSSAILSQMRTMEITAAEDKSDPLPEELLTRSWTDWTTAMKRTFLREVRKEQQREPAGAVARISRQYDVPEWNFPVWVNDSSITDPQLMENHEADVVGMMCIALTKKYVDLQGFDFEGLQKAIDRARLIVRAKIRRGSHMASLFEKAAVEALPYVQKIRGRGENILDDDGEVPINGTVCVGLKRYSILHGLSNDRLWKAVCAARLPSLATAMSGCNTVKVYEKAAVEKLPYVTKYKGVEKTPPRDDGITTIGGVEGICCSTFYTDTHGLDFGYFASSIAMAKLPVIGRVRNGSHIVLVYEKAKVEALPYIRERIHLTSP